MLYKKIVAIQKSPNLDIKLSDDVPKKATRSRNIQITNHGETSTSLYAK
jgi:hypothetical protein